MYNQHPPLLGKGEGGRGEAMVLICLAWCSGSPSCALCRGHVICVAVTQNHKSIQLGWKSSRTLTELLDECGLSFRLITKSETGQASEGFAFHCNHFVELH